MDGIVLWEAVWEWAWARHHNILSWYIRPLFVLPFCYFAYRRSPFGMVATLMALATSMAWFPAPATPSPGVVELLARERAYLAEPWTPFRILLALVPAALLAALATAFWRRSFAWGIAVINAMALTKIAWTFWAAPGEGAYALLVPALVGLGICNAAVIGILAIRKQRPPSTGGIVMG